jgi:hypothetical protein
MKRPALPPALLGLLLAGCGGAPTAPSAASAADGVRLHTGCCDASTGVALDERLFVVANDEDNALRVYARDQSGPPVQSLELDAFLDLDPKSPETDLEASARVGDRVYWLSSHGRNKTGKARPNRRRFFATTFHVTGDRVEWAPVGRPYENLAEDLAAAPGLQAFRLGEAAARAPEEPGGLNLEGLTATAEGHLLIGFRSPVPDGLALLVPLLNPADLLEGRPARFGEAIRLDLGGRGVRSLTSVGDDLLIVAGASGNGGQPALYRLTAGQLDPWPTSTPLTGLNPEGLLVFPGVPAIDLLLLSDDGGQKINGVDCKKLKDPAQRRFRSVPVRGLGKT